MRKKLQFAGLLFVLPLSFFFAIWVVSLGDGRLVLLPFIGAGVLLMGGIIGLLVSKIMKKDARGRGTFFCICSFTNIGAIGGLVTYGLLGEAGFGYLVMYKLLEELVYYLVGFPIARYYSSSYARRTVAERLIAVLKDPFVLTALTAFTIGLSLNVIGIKRPVAFATLNSYLVPLASFLLLISIGMGLKISRIGDYLPEALVTCTVKFLLLPLVAVGLGLASGFALIENGLPLKAVLIASSMPVAFNTVVAASIFDLDLDMANSCWILTTLCLVAVVPLLSLLLRLI